MSIIYLPMVSLEILTSTILEYFIINLDYYSGCTIGFNFSIAGPAIQHEHPVTELDDGIDITACT